MHSLSTLVLQKYTKGKNSVISATLSGEVEGYKLTFKVEADLSEISEVTFEAEHLPLHRLAAKAQIKELQDNESKCIHPSPPSRVKFKYSILSTVDYR